jgi:hypothetical protein
MRLGARPRATGLTTNLKKKRKNNMDSDKRMNIKDMNNENM